jgi:hypothetical protein
VNLKAWDSVKKITIAARELGLIRGLLILGCVMSGKIINPPISSWFNYSIEIIIPTVQGFLGIKCLDVVNTMHAIKDMPIS